MRLLRKKARILLVERKKFSVGLKNVKGEKLDAVGDYIIVDVGGAQLSC